MRIMVIKRIEDRLSIKEVINSKIRNPNSIYLSGAHVILFCFFKFFKKIICFKNKIATAYLYVFFKPYTISSQSKLVFIIS